MAVSAPAARCIARAALRDRFEAAGGQCLQRASEPPQRLLPGAAQPLAEHERRGGGKQQQQRQRATDFDPHGQQVGHRGAGEQRPAIGRQVRQFGHDGRDATAPLVLPGAPGTRCRVAVRGQLRQSLACIQGDQLRIDGLARIQERALAIDDRKARVARGSRIHAAPQPVTVDLEIAEHRLAQRADAADEVEACIGIARMRAQQHLPGSERQLVRAAQRNRRLGRGGRQQHHAADRLGVQQALADGRAAAVRLDGGGRLHDGLGGHQARLQFEGVAVGEFEQRFDRLALFRFADAGNRREEPAGDDDGRQQRKVQREPAGHGTGSMGVSWEHVGTCGESLSAI